MLSDSNYAQWIKNFDKTFNSGDSVAGETKLAYKLCEKHATTVKLRAASNSNTDGNTSADNTIKSNDSLSHCTSKTTTL